jgi:hypothetical protein
VGGCPELLIQVAESFQGSERLKARDECLTEDAHDEHEERHCHQKFNHGEAPLGRDRRAFCGA